MNIKRLPNNKKILIALVLFVFFLRCFYIVALGEVDKIYKTSKSDLDLSVAELIPCADISQFFSVPDGRLNSIEFAFSDIAPDKKGKISIRILNQDDLVWAGNISLSNLNNNEWKRVYVNIPSIDGEYQIQLSSIDCTTIPNVFLLRRELSSVENTRLFVGDEEYTLHAIGLKYGSLLMPSTLEKTIRVIMWGMATSAVILSIIFCDQITRCIKRIWKQCLGNQQLDLMVLILEILLGYLLIEDSGIEFQAPTKFVLLLISFICGWGFQRKALQTADLLNSVGKRTGFFLVLMFSSFSMTGNRTLLWPINSKITTAKVLLFIAAALWFVPVIMTCLTFIRTHYKKVLSDGRRLQTTWFIILVILLLIIPAAISLYAFNPLISSPDTESCIRQAHKLRHSSDWFPPFYYMFLRAAFEIWDHVTAAVIEQWIFWIYVLVEAVLFLRKWLKDWVLLLFAAMLGFNTANYLYLDTVWKDIPYCCALLWLAVIVSRLVLEDGVNKKRYMYIEFTAAMVGTYFFRKNGIVPYIMVFAMILILFRKNKRAVLSVFASIPIILLIQYPLYNYLEVEKASADSMYLGFGEDVLGVYYAGGELTQDAINMVTQLTKENNAEFSYNPTYYGFSANDIDMTTPRFIKDVFTTAVQNPVSFIRATLAREDMTLAIFPGQMSHINNVNYRGTREGNEGWDSIAPKRIENGFTTWISTITAYSVSNQLLNITTWRCGIYFWLAAVVWFIIRSAQREKKSVALIIVLAGQFLGLWMCCGWSGEFRYFWPINLLALFLLFELPVVLRCHEEEVRGDMA